ncbi:MAG: hypothetical protein Q9M16_08540 [Mariprofundus sp.]|nr:hypothetical protein [Mariprofundus sp.]
MKRICFGFLILIFMAPFAHTAHAADDNHEASDMLITANQVYAEVERIEADVLSIMKSRKRASTARIKTIAAHFKPRHVWQKTYEVLVKINIFRRAENYPTISVSALEPTKTLHPKMLFDQSQRILTELNLIKLRLNIQHSSPTPPVRKLTGKTSNDVYALLDKVSNDLDSLIGYGFTPSDVFSQAIRLNSDIELILQALDVTDDSFPPLKHKNSQPADAYRAAMQLLQTVNRLQRFLSIDVSDFSGLKKDTIRPADVFELIGLINAELQPIKFALSLPYARTPASKHYEAKIPADVEQLIGWSNNRLQQVHSSSL